MKTGIRNIEQRRRRAMTRSVSLILIIALLTALTLLTLGGNSDALAEDSQTRSVTVSDVIKMTRLGDPEYDNGHISAGLVAKFSPDGKQFVVVLRKGSLAHNTNEYSLLLWRTDQLFHSPTYQILLTMSSSSNRPGIEEIRWLTDNTTITFLGERPGESHQLYTFNILTRQLKKITNHPTNIVSYDITPAGHKIAYVAAGPVESIFDEKALQNGAAISTEQLYNVIVDRKGDGWGRDNPQLFVQQDRQPSRQLRIPGKFTSWGNIPWLSPNGTFIVLATQVMDIPEDWEEYTDANLHWNIDLKRRRGKYSRVKRYIIVDSRTGQSRVLIDAPIKRRGEVAWSPSSRSVAIAGVYLPLKNSDGDELKARQSKTFAVEVDTEGRKITTIGNEDLSLWGWREDDLLVLSKSEDPMSEVFFQKRGDKWEEVDNPSKGKARQLIELDENMNVAPRIFAINTETNQKTLLMDLNPQFKNLRFARVEEIKWKSTEGFDVHGGLYYPADYVPGKKYPLVIQTHGWRGDKFLIDGPWTSGFAAQPLAGKGFMVLQAATAAAIDTSTSVEGPREAASFEGAIEYLDQQGLIDRNRVGIFGFSRTCFHVKYALTHSKYHIAAASVEDGVDGGYFQYLALLPNSDVSKDFEGMIGAAPFGEGLRAWIERSPGFSIDRVKTPVRIVAHDATSAVLEWEWYSALTRLEKPVDMVMMQDALHLLQRPWDRMIASDGNVDWFSFWLKSEEDTDPAKAEQYTRWRELRKLQQENEAKAKAASVN
jgi:dipeptidyl aminopeptidase/acylaminoacyl peptidase